VSEAKAETVTLTMLRLGVTLDLVGGHFMRGRPQTGLIETGHNLVTDRSWPLTADGLAAAFEELAEKYRNASAIALAA
jgi:hypothetical protein